MVGKHAFVVYKLVALLMGAKAVEVEMPGLTHDLEAMREAVTERTKLIFLPSPNNPTGTANSISEISAFVSSLPEHAFFAWTKPMPNTLTTPSILCRSFAKGEKSWQCGLSRRFTDWLD